MRSSEERRDSFLKELATQLSSPVHARLIQAYKGDTPLENMLAELSQLLLEVAQSED